MTQTQPGVPLHPSAQPLAIEDYALIGDCASAALVGKNGSVDWLCWPRFDSGACFAALLGTPENGRCLIAPRADRREAGPEDTPESTPGGVLCTRRAYRGDTMVLETVFDRPGGCVALVDFMVPGAPHPTLIRIVEGRRGRVAMRAETELRFDYGRAVPWVTRLEGDERGVVAVAGPALVVMRAPVPMHGEGQKTVAEFDVSDGQRLAFVLGYGPSHLPPPPPTDAEAALARTEAYWRDWAARCTYDGPWAGPVRRSLLALKALTYAPTGGIVAAPTTSLPEQLGGARNWDYRFCWLRDATVTLIAFMGAGYRDEAAAWADWLRRAVAGSLEGVQIMYGLSGERRMPEQELPWLPGYQGAAPVRVGNGAAEQLQLDVYGEVMDALYQARAGGVPLDPASWALQRAMVTHLEDLWQQPDAGLWEARGEPRHYTFNKIMVWVAFDRAIRTAAAHDLPAPVERWRAARDRVHETVCRDGYDSARGTFTQSFGDPALDASLLLIAVLGFLPPEDPRVHGTIAAVERGLVRDGLVWRYRTDDGGEIASDGLPPGEGAFLMCGFWYAMALHRQGRADEARAVFERLVGLCNDVGLLSEEYDPRAGRFTGNFPQAFSHVGLVIAAMTLTGRVASQAAPPEGVRAAD